MAAILTIFGPNRSRRRKLFFDFFFARAGERTNKETSDRTSDRTSYLRNGIGLFKGCSDALRTTP